MKKKNQGEKQKNEKNKKRKENKFRPKQTVLHKNIYLEYTYIYNSSSC